MKGLDAYLARELATSKKQEGERQESEQEAERDITPEGANAQEGREHEPCK